jgi:small subunit ribosomal protein S3
VTDGDLRAEQNAAEDAAIREAVQHGVARAAGLVVVEIERTSDQVRVYVHTTQPDIVLGHGGAEADRIRDELQQLTSKHVRLDVLRVPSPPGA